MDMRAKFFYGQHKNILTDRGVYKPMETVQLFKYHEQYRYNRGKPGLDNNTEVVLRIYKSTTVYFETKYLLIMIDQVLINYWRGEVAVSVLKPWIMQVECTSRRYPTLDQIRRKFNKSGTIDDYV